MSTALLALLFSSSVGLAQIEVPDVECKVATIPPTSPIYLRAYGSMLGNSSIPVLENVEGYHVELRYLKKTESLRSVILKVDTYDLSSLSGELELTRDTPQYLKVRGKIGINCYIPRSSM